MNYFFCMDIDGCITNGKGRLSDMTKLSELTTAIVKSFAYFSLCTGRSAPYVEAIAQVIGVKRRCICENGAYIYHPMTDEFILNPLVSDSTTNALNSLRFQFSQGKYKQLCRLEPGKDICISLNPIDIPIEELFNLLKNDIDNNLLYINHSTTAVDITPKGVDKGSGLKLLAELEGFDLADVLAIGDSSGDLPFMTLAGKKACPANATDPVKAISDYISPYPTTEGVIDIINHFSHDT